MRDALWRPFRRTIQDPKMKTLILLIIIISSSAAYGSQTTEWINQLEHPHWDINQLRLENYKSQYINYDFTNLFMPGSKFLGYIGPTYTRINIDYQAIYKITPDTYHVTGVSMVDRNKRSFSGLIVIKQVRSFKIMHYGCDNEFIDAGFKAQGLLVGEYTFKENPLRRHSGTLKGIMTLYWLIDKNNHIQYDDIDLSFSDNYKNNQYIGTWSEYGTGIKKTCNWGEYRIPFPGDLDYGASAFGVNPKYYNQGWDEFRRN